MTSGEKMFDASGYHREKLSTTVTPTLNAFDQPMTFKVQAATNFGLRDVSTSLSSKQQRIDGDTETFVVAGHADYKQSDGPTLRASGGDLGGGSEGLIAFAWQQGVSENDRSYPVRKGEYSGSLSESRTDAISNSTGVRRLTPTECERLQGFPDGWTSGFSDSVRYRMLGNAVTVSVIRWLGKRIIEADR